MKLRYEKEGLHLYDRNTGIHILLDEYDVPLEKCCCTPRTVSVAITNCCDFCCKHCHIPKGNVFLSKNTLLEVARAFDDIGSFDIALGGGEPTLHPDLVDICHSLWDNTSLGISITTNGHHLNDAFINDLRGIVSILRFSVDGTYNVYERVRKRPYKTLLDNMYKAKGKIPIGLNVLINEYTITDLDRIEELALDLNATEVLLLPIIKDMEFDLKKQEWTILEQWINTNYKALPLRVLSLARNMMNIPLLFESDNWDTSYVYIDQDLYLRNDSYSHCSGIKIDNPENIKMIFQNLTPLSP